MRILIKLFEVFEVRKRKYSQLEKENFNSENIDPNKPVGKLRDSAIAISKKHSAFKDKEAIVVPEEFRKMRGGIYCNKAMEEVYVNSLRMFLVLDIKLQFKNGKLHGESDESIIKKMRLVFDHEFSMSVHMDNPSLTCSKLYIEGVVVALHKYDNAALLDWVADYLMQVECVNKQVKSLVKYPLSCALRIKQRNSDRASVTSMKLFKNCPEWVSGFESKEMRETGVYFRACS